MIVVSTIILFVIFAVVFAFVATNLMDLASDEKLTLSSLVKQRKADIASFFARLRQ